MEVPVLNVVQMKVWSIRTAALPATHVDIPNVANYNT